MTLPATKKLYLQEGDCYEIMAVFLGTNGDALAFNQTCFFPGGGGQPPDQGEIRLADGRRIDIISTFADPQGIIWHVSREQVPVLEAGQACGLRIDPQRRWIIMRYHTVLHVLNTIVLRDHEAQITGVQIGPDHSRIDFKIERFHPELAAELESKVNAVLAEDHPVKSYYLSEAEFRQRPELIRTLTVKPPIVDGQVRIVEIEGFDAQACGGTHVHSTRETGQMSIVRMENKGRYNKRLYVRLDSQR